MAFYSYYPFLPNFYFAFFRSKLSVYTDLLAIRKGSYSKIRAFQGRLVGHSAYPALSPLGWAWA